MDALTTYISTVFATIDGVESIFEVIRIQLEAADTAKKCNKQLKLVQTACGQVMASEDLKRLLQVAHYLNPLNPLLLSLSLILAWLTCSRPHLPVALAAHSRPHSLVLALLAPSLSPAPTPAH